MLNHNRIAIYIALASMLALGLFACATTPADSTSASDPQPGPSASAPTSRDNASSSSPVEAAPDTTPSTENPSSSADSSAASAFEAADSAAAHAIQIASDYGTLRATLEANDATATLVSLLKDGPIELDLHEYGGFEIIGTLPQSLPTNDEHIDAQPGDIVLYQGNQLSFFYGTNSWSYTRIGHIEDSDGNAILEALGGTGDSTVTLSLG